MLSPAVLLSIPQELGCSLPDTPSASMSAALRNIFPCLIPSMSVLEGLCLCTCPACLPHPPVADLTPRGSLLTTGRGTATTLSSLVLWAPTRFYLARLINPLHSIKTCVISSLICLFSKLEKSLCILRKKPNPYNMKNANPKPNPSSLTKPRNNSLLRLF